MNLVKPPARRPCESCPYRQDVPSGIWHPDEYAKLPRYDLPTYQQPIGLFLCHLTGTDTPASRAGRGGAWVTRCRPCIRDEHGACRGDRDRAISCNCECLDLECCLDGTCGRCVDENEGI